MSHLTFTTSQSDQDLKGIIALQRDNLQRNLEKDEIASQGFVTVVHTLENLRKMNDIEQHVICKDGEKVVGYILAMTANSRNDIPMLIPMFELCDTITYQNRKISDYRYIVVGQVCIAKTYRGQGVFEKSYHAYRDRMKGRYDIVITEIATRNLRSINAHARIGFIEIHRYVGDTGEEWSFVVWPLK
jgi:hypothetical protein